MTLLATQLQALRTQYPNMLDQHEWRYTRYGIIQAAKEHMASPFSIITPDIEAAAMASFDREVEIPVMRRANITISNARSCTIGDFENTTGLVNLTWKTYAFDISMVPAQYTNNELTYQTDLNRKLLAGFHAMALNIENDFALAIDAEKAVFSNSSLVGTKYPVVADALQVAVADQEFFYNDVPVIMNEDNYWNEPWTVLASTSHKAPVNKFFNQGAQNDTNLNYQFGGRYVFRFSNQIVNAALKTSTGYIMPDGTLGMLTRVDPDSALGHEAQDAKWSTVLNPIIDIECGVLYKSICYDASGLAVPMNAGKTATMKENWQVSVDVAFLFPHISDPASEAAPIRKFEFL